MCVHARMTTPPNTIICFLLHLQTPLNAEDITLHLRLYKPPEIIHFTFRKQNSSPIQSGSQRESSFAYKYQGDFIQQKLCVVYSFQNV